MRRLRWTEPAYRDFTHICDYTHIHFSQAQAWKTSTAITDAVAILKRNPFAGRIGRKPNTLELVISGLPFLAVYRVKADEVEVLRVLHGAQKWP